MGNIVTVSRAPRLKFVCPNYAGFYVNTIDMKIWCNTDRGMVCLDNDSFRIKEGYDWHHKFVRLELLGDVIKWVAGGRKLEDLQVDASSELKKFQEIPIGTIFTQLEEDVPSIKADHGRAVRLNGRYGNVIQLDDTINLVWPIGPGDSITIESEKP